MTAAPRPNQALSCAAITLVGLAILTSIASAAPGKQSQRAVTATATVLKTASITVARNLSSGAVKTEGSNPTGAVVIPASYPLLSTPTPSYPSTEPVNGANAQAGYSAQVNVTGSPGAAFTLNFQGWTEVSGQAGSSASGVSNTYYSPSASPSPNVPQGVFDAQGNATIYIGSTITVARNNPGTTVVLKPSFTLTYN